MTEEQEETPLVVPWREISPEALRGLLESFVLREGTDYGPREFSLAEKVAHVRAQLERGEAVVIFETRTGSVDIRPARSDPEVARRPLP